jgi:hypothetical protein
VFFELASMMGTNVGICLPRASKSQTRKGKNEANKLESKGNKECGKVHRKLGSTSIAPD